MSNVIELKPGKKYILLCKGADPPALDGLIAYLAEQGLARDSEMVGDWLAASERSQTPFEDGREKNKARFSLDEQLYQVLRNTAYRLAPDKFQGPDPWKGE